MEKVRMEDQRVERIKVGGNRERERERSGWNRNDSSQAIK
jgi:hypothetical protein